MLLQKSPGILHGGYKYVRPSQVKSAPTPVGEPNLRAEAEKKNIDTPETIQPTGVSQKTW